MALQWGSVSREHVAEACELVAAESWRPLKRGLVVVHGQQLLPAKRVLKVAYCLAHGLPTDAEVKFASGEATLSLLKRLGFTARRAEQV
jgi:hypothetical protein